MSFLACPVPELLSKLVFGMMNQAATFNANNKRLVEFLTLYKKEMGIPFVCQLRVELATEEQFELLKVAGVTQISIGLGIHLSNHEAK